MASILIRHVFAGRVLFALPAIVVRDIGAVELEIMTAGEAWDVV